MKDDNGIERQIKWEKEEQTVKGVQHAILRISKEGLATELVGVPQWEAAIS